MGVDRRRKVRGRKGRRDEVGESRVKMGVFTTTIFCFVDLVRCCRPCPLKHIYAYA
jgi:hypothetical protein